MLLGRVFAYADTHRYRIGTNYLQLPVNQPKVAVDTYQFDGAMPYDFNPGQPVYSPNSVGGPAVHADLFADATWESDGDLVRSAYTLRAEDDDFSQSNVLVNKVMDQAERDRMVETIASTLGTVRPDIREWVFSYWRSVDKTVGGAVAELVNGRGVEPHGPAPATNDPDTPVNKDV